MSSDIKNSIVKVAIPPLLLVLGVALAYCLPGMVGHQPWKPDEGYIFAGIFHMLQSGDWIVPYLAGETFMEKPPLYHWMAAATATLASPWLPLHDGARLASGVFIGITLWATALASSLAWGKGRGRIAILMLLGTFGLLNTVALMLPDLPLMAGFALATLGLVAHAFERKWAYLALGIGAGMGFLAKGLLAPGALAVAALALPIYSAHWRDRRYFRFLMFALLAALPWLIIWPALLYVRDPVAFMTWLWDNNIGRFLGFSVAALGASSERGFWTKTFPWFVFPWWIFIAVALWKTRASLMRETGMQVGLSVGLSLALVLAISSSARGIYALPLLPALALAATGAQQHVPVRLWKFLGALGVVIAVLVATSSWYLWSTLIWAGEAPNWQWIARNLPLKFSLPLSLSAVAVAALVFAGWLAVIWYRRRFAQGPLLVWTASIAISWALPVVLLMPWIDSAKGYDAVYDSMARALPSSYSCIQSEQLGESERGILEYAQGIVTVRKEVSPTVDCPFLMRQLKSDMPAPAGHWILLWAGNRPSCVNERFELYASQTLAEGRTHAESLRKNVIAMKIGHINRVKGTFEPNPLAD